MLDRVKTLVVVIDAQERMMPVIEGTERVVDNITRLVRGSLALGLPMLVTEQYSKGLGGTVQPIASAMQEWYRPIEKMTFSAVESMPFMQQLETTGATKVLLCGVEAHICVFQTASDLRQVGWDVEVVADAIGSRSDFNRGIALERMHRHGIELTTVEMALFSIMRTADCPEFKSVSQIVK